MFRKRVCRCSIARERCKQPAPRSIMPKSYCASEDLPYGDPFLTSTLLSVRLPLFPQLKVELTSGFSCDLVHDVLSGRVDLALVTEPPESPMLSMTKVDEAPLYIALLEENELAKLPQLSMSDLSHENWIIFGRSVHPPLYDRTCRLLRPGHPASGYAPHHGSRRGLPTYCRKEWGSIALEDRCAQKCS